MGLGGIGVWQLLIILLIVFMLFGTKKLRNLGSDLGGRSRLQKRDEGRRSHGCTDEGEETGETIEATAEKVETKS